MKSIIKTFICCFAILAVSVSQAADETIMKMEPRDGGMFRTVILDPGDHFAAAVLIQGGKGKLNIKDDGIHGGKKNYLIHFRDRYVDAGMLVAVADAPRDYYKGQGMKADHFRLTQEHADDIAAVIQDLRQRTNKPIWLIGTSRGSISAVNAAARLTGSSAPDGLVLTSTVVVTNDHGHANAFDVDLSGIKVPVLMTHHEDDGCPSSPYSKATDLEKAFPSSPVVAFKTYAGGDAGDDDDRCNRLSPHGFYGQEDKTIEDIVNWVKEHS